MNTSAYAAFYQPQKTYEKKWHEIIKAYLKIVLFEVKFKIFNLRGFFLIICLKKLISNKNDSNFLNIIYYESCLIHLKVQRLTWKLT